MRIDALLPRSSDNCIDCPSTPSCNCAANQVCILINRSCNACPSVTCVSNTSAISASGSGGVSKGALAGAVVGSFIFLAAAVCLFLFYRRNQRYRRAIAASRETKEDLPAPAATVLNRPDPTEKPSTPTTEPNRVRVYSTSSDTTIDLDPNSEHSPQHSSTRVSVQSNPFSDNHSIQTAGTESTNVIPIALVSPDSHRAPSESESLPTSDTPARPPRSPDLNLNLEHVNVSRDSVRGGLSYAQSQISGISGVSSRNSYLSNASFSSDFLNEAPMIITPNKGAVRQVLGVVKAEMISAGSLSPNTADGLRPPSLISRPSIGSPLASTSFGPADVLKEEDEGQEVTVDPFNDENASTRISPSASVATFGQPSPSRTMHNSTGSEWVPEGPTLPWANPDGSRPSSMSTQAGSVVDIGSATRVNVGLNGYNAAGYARSPYRTTMGRLVTPSTALATSGSGTFEEQQQNALAHAQARALAQGADLSRRISDSSVMSAASTRADSILESFPFVPPSPISGRPMRSPPVSPLTQQSFTSSASSSPLAQQSFTTTATSPSLGQALLKENAASKWDGESALPAPPDRRTLGLSTGSQLSTASSGLGSFPFQIDSDNSHDSSTPPSAFSGRQRASLDTLALTSDLSSYPLLFDRDTSSRPNKGQG